MKKSRYSDSQIIAILKQNEAGATVPDLCREHGISSASLSDEASRVVPMNFLTRTDQT